MSTRSSPARCRSSRRTFFALRAIAFFSLVAAGFWMGSYFGFERGYVGPSNQTQPLYEKIYDVSDLLPSKDHPEAVAEFDTLIDVITSMIEPTTWDEVGGPGTIIPMSDRGPLKVTQTATGHSCIADWIDHLRSHAASRSSDEHAYDNIQRHLL